MAPRHDIVIIGGGSAGVSVAARLKRAGVGDVAVVDPAVTHYYQPLWTLVGGGRAPVEESARSQESVMPKGITWIRQAAAEIDPDAQEITLDDGSPVGYSYLVVCPGIQLDWDKITGLRDTLGRDGVSSNYSYELAPATWKFIRDTRSGTAVFGMPAGPIKCAGAPQKIAYLAADYWRQQGVLKDIDVHLVLPTPAMFGVKEFSDVLVGVARRYGITVHLESEVTAVRPDAREAVVTSKKDDSTQTPAVLDDAPGAAAERPGLDQEECIGRPVQSGRIRRARQAHHAAHPLPERVRPWGRRLVTELEDRGRDP